MARLTNRHKGAGETGHRSFGTALAGHLDLDPAAGAPDAVALQLLAAGVDAVAGLDVELPEVDVAGQDALSQVPVGQGGALVRAGILERPEFVVAAQDQVLVLADRHPGDVAVPQLVVVVDLDPLTHRRASVR